MANVIDISKDNVKGTCDYKCSYNFNYSNTNLTAKNKGMQITLTGDNDNGTPVVYNNEKYSVFQINIFASSLHTYDGVKQDAELIIHHVPELGGPHLFVCIPMGKSSESSTAGDLLTQVIENIASSAPDKGESTTLNVSNFTLQSIVPNKPYVMYTGVFGKTEAILIVFPRKCFIPLSQTTITALTSIINPFSLEMTGGEMTANNKGPNSKLKQQGIYIDCNPTGSYDGSTSATSDTSSSASSSASSSSSLSPAEIKGILKYLLVLSVIAAVFFILSYMFSTLTQLKRIA